MEKVIVEKYSSKATEISSLKKVWGGNIADKLIKEKSNDINLKLNRNQLSREGEDVDVFFNQLFKYRGAYLKENWDTIINIEGKVLKVKDGFIDVDCLINKEDEVFQTREFPLNLFSHLTNLTEGLYVLIKVCARLGASRIDIYDGTGIVNKELFNINDDWESLRNVGLDTPFEGW